MAIIPDLKKDTRYIIARVCNAGTAATTITNMALGTYESFWQRKRMRRSWCAVVKSPSPAQPIPFKLEVGEQWCGQCIQSEEIQKLIDTGKLWCEIFQSWSKKPVMGRVISGPVKPVVKPK